MYVCVSACVYMYIYVCMYITHFLKLVCHEKAFVSLLNYFLLDNCLFMFFFLRKNSSLAGSFIKILVNGHFASLA